MAAKQSNKLPFRVFHLAEVTSTNDWMKGRCKSGKCADQDIAIAYHQTSGRGCGHKEWYSEAGKNVTLSVFKIFSDLSCSKICLINYAASMALIDILSQYNCPSLHVKWPNDIISKGKKIGGILVETRMEKNKVKDAVIGVGMNVNQTRFPGLPSATSMALLLKKTFCPNDMALLLVEKLFSLLRIDNTPDETNLINNYQNNLWGLGYPCNFMGKEQQFSAIVTGVTNNGMLKIRHTNGKEACISQGNFNLVPLFSQQVPAN